MATSDNTDEKLTTQDDFSDNTDEKLTTQDDFSELFIKFVDAMVDFEHFSRETLVDVLCRLARSFRLTKVVTEFYRSRVDEKRRQGRNPL